MLLKLFRWLIGGCEHHWAILKKIDVYEGNTSYRPFRFDYHLQCEKCGSIKVKKT